MELPYNNPTVQPTMWSHCPSSYVRGKLSFEKANTETETAMRCSHRQRGISALWGLIAWHWINSFIQQRSNKQSKLAGRMAGNKHIPPIRRYITTHNDDGEAIFLSACQVPECAPSRSAGDDGEVALLYATDTFPIKTDNEADVAVYDSYLHTPPGLTPDHGTVMRVVDMQPLKATPMHRTISVDYGVVLEGEVELVLDSGQSRVMKRGDVSIQRGTSHSYRNLSATEWCRLLFVFFPMEPVQVAGRQLKEEWYDDGDDGSDGHADGDNQSGNPEGNQQDQKQKGRCSP